MWLLRWKPKQSPLQCLTLTFNCVTYSRLILRIEEKVSDTEAWLKYKITKNKNVNLLESEGRSALHFTADLNLVIVGLV